jgi:CHASE3 domain sensor protein
MKKISIKSRVFFSFTIFVILLTNIFSYFLFLYTENSIINNTKKSIINEYETIKTFIDLQNTPFINIPKYEIEKINNL